MRAVDVTERGTPALAHRLTGSQTDYTYSGGLRIGAATTVGGDTSTESFTWDTLAGVPLLLSDGGHEYIYGLGSSPVAQVDTATGSVTFLHGDLVGSTRAATDVSGAQVGSWDYTPFGVVTTATGGAAGDGAGVTRFLFAGEYQDDSGLTYLRARFFDPVTASFLSVDPALSQTGSPYAYASGNPLQLVDPLGLFSLPNPLAGIPNVLNDTVKHLTRGGSVSDFLGTVDCNTFGGFFGDAKNAFGATWGVASNDWGNTLTFVANNVNPINAMATYGSISYAQSTGGSCAFSTENMMFVCGGAEWHARGGTTLGSTFISADPLDKLLDDPQLLGHEEVHAFQEAVLGLPLFGGFYGLSEGTRSVIGAITPKEGDWGEGCNYWEELAGLTEGVNALRKLVR